MDFDFGRLSVRLPNPAVSDVDYDLGYFTIGYEERAGFIPSKLAGRTYKMCGISYQDTKAFGFSQNLEFAKSMGVTVVKAIDYRVDQNGYFASLISERVFDLKQHHIKRVWLDVSAMDRSLMARVLLSVLNALRPPFVLRIVYAPAVFVDPSYAFTPVRDCAPAIPEFAGALGLRDRQVSLVLGLGYEYGVALGLVQQHEPNAAYAFVPEGEDGRFGRAVARANCGFDFGNDEVRLLNYRVNQPLSVFDRLFALTINSSVSNRFIFVPNGPKIFAAITILTALLRRPWISVLRASRSVSAPAHMVKAAGQIIAVDLVCE